MTQIGSTSGTHCQFATAEPTITVASNSMQKPANNHATSATKKVAGLLGMMALLAFLAVASVILGAKITTTAQVYEAMPLAWEMVQSHTDVASAIAAGHGEELTEIAGIIATMRIPRTILAMHYQGIPEHRVLHLRGFLPGNHSCSDRSGRWRQA